MTKTTKTKKPARTTEGYTAITKLSKEISIKVPLIRNWLLSHGKHIDFFEKGSYTYIKTTENERLLLIKQLYYRGWNALEVDNLLTVSDDKVHAEEHTEAPTDIDESLIGLSRKQLINAFYDGKYPEGMYFTCLVSNQTVYFSDENIHAFKTGFPLGVSRTAERWVMTTRDDVFSRY